ncbi:hypothetical protein BO70DRAFT_115261 [Aspergillus heteromorphus CBS 117.55]|uniref:Hydantoinase B/oxoprolinase domain-containing protein n=1 Tax=Aspergillus heteromorphus CBS 117.55 TaxID=1448321 RepID=A0A317VGJ3_9EURO|nr:uncharacterized protein BO70DRAFT_115261 [Aspergillus heteromorphus CBS 117.55]PWY72271.1 hypothetical protein BO70DRAFT_115261 [Aspergillus heteromorphus CBS 117.55]
MPILIPSRQLCISIDRGGTFTDCICKVPGEEDIVVKFLSVDPKNYDDAPTEAIRKVLEIYYGKSIPRRTGLDTKDIGRKHSPGVQTIHFLTLAHRMNSNGNNNRDKRGDGAHPGGEGVIRDVEFRTPMTASVLSERHSFSPYGMAGEDDGKRRLNTWVQHSGTTVSIGGKNSILVSAGDRMVIETPGGGGYGRKQDRLGQGLLSDMSKVMPSFVPLANGSVEATRSLAEQV